MPKPITVFGHLSKSNNRLKCLVLGKYHGMFSPCTLVSFLQEDCLKREILPVTCLVNGIPDSHQPKLVKSPSPTNKVFTNLERPI